MLDEEIGCTLCGVLILSGASLPIYIREESGDVLYEDVTNGTVMMVSPLTERNPIEVEKLHSVQEAIVNKTYGNAIGIVFTTEKAIVILDEDTAEYRPYSNLFESSGQTVRIDLNLMDPNNE
jgi:hypothetical protein